MSFNNSEFVLSFLVERNILEDNMTIGIIFSALNFGSFLIFQDEFKFICLKRSRTITSQFFINEDISFSW